MKLNLSQKAGLLSVWRAPGCVARYGARNKDGRIHPATAKSLIRLGLLKVSSDRYGVALTTAGEPNGYDAARELAKQMR